MTWPQLRDISSFVIGAVGLYHETYSRSAQERPTLIAAFLALMASPALWRANGAKKK